MTPRIPDETRAVILTWFGAEGQSGSTRCRPPWRGRRRLGFHADRDAAGGAVSFVAGGTLADGREAVLKVAPLDEENRHEAAALRVGPAASVRLLQHDAERNACCSSGCGPARRCTTPVWAGRRRPHRGAADRPAGRRAAAGPPVPAAGRRRPDVAHRRHAGGARRTADRHRARPLGAGEPRPARAQHPPRRRSLADDRPEAAGRRPGVHGRRDAARPPRRARPSGPTTRRCCAGGSRSSARAPATIRGASRRGRRATRPSWTSRRSRRRCCGSLLPRHPRRGVEEARDEAAG